MATKTDTASPTQHHGVAHEDNPLAPTHSRPAHPHYKPPSRRLAKKKQQRSGQRGTSDENGGGSHDDENGSTVDRRRGPRQSSDNATPMSALLMPLGGILALACVFRLFR